METAVRTPLEIFNLPQHLVVPPFQRPYVWTRDDQWQPLWGDIRRLAELRLKQPWANATHFLGAVVLQAGENQSGTLQPRSIVDGQQRLTTLQLLIDATSAVFRERSLDDLSAQLEGLAHNAAHFVTDGNDLKLRQSNRDSAAFREVMGADPPIDYAGLSNPRSLLVGAHEYFGSAVRGWLDEREPDLRLRATALTAVLSNGLQLVVIDLRRDENSQEIFETLNARGTPLTAADLVKNLVFQRLAAEGVEANHSYGDLWPFDSPFWEREVSAGRYGVSRSSLFINQWLISRIGEEVGPRSTFARFKHYVEHETDRTMFELLAAVRAQAEQYQRWTERAADPNADLSALEMCVYRSQALESEVLKPVLLWLTDPEHPVDVATLNAVVKVLESWLVRRSLLRLTSADHSRVVADLIATHRGSAGEELALRIENYLRRQTASSTYWPSDEELRVNLRGELFYRRFRRPRLRMFLEAVEDHYRGFTSPGSSLTGMRVPRLGFPIEHVLPQRWRDHWPVDSLPQEIDRDDHVHRLGNLTLLTTSLNSTVSNGPWGGPGGKRAKFEAHDVLLLNREIRKLGEHGWAEATIDHRTMLLVEAMIAVWPAPQGHTVKANVPAPDPTWVTIRDLLAAELLQPGTAVIARPGSWGHREAVVQSDGNLVLDGQEFTSVSAAGHHLRGGSTNGWTFWRLQDGRRLFDLRTEYLELKNGVKAPPASDESN